MASWKNLSKPWSFIALIIFILSCSSSYFSESLAHLKLNSHKNRENILCSFIKILGFLGNNFEMNLCDLTVVFRREFALDLILNRGWHNYLWWHDEHEHFDLHNEMKIRLLSVELDFLLPSRIYGQLRPVSRTLNEYSDQASAGRRRPRRPLIGVLWNSTSSDFPQDGGYEEVPSCGALIQTGRSCRSLPSASSSEWASVEYLFVFFTSFDQIITKRFCIKWWQTDQLLTGLIDDKTCLSTFDYFS